MNKNKNIALIIFVVIAAFGHVMASVVVPPNVNQAFTK